VAAVLIGCALPMLTVGLVHAGLPSPPPIPGVTQPIHMLIEPPSVTTVSVPVDPDGCAVDTSYDNTQAAPPGSIYRGQTACGSGVYAPILVGQARLSDVFGNVVSTAPQFGARGNGPYTSQGDYLAVPTTGVPTTISGAGAVPGMDYTITFNTDITLVWPQYWGPAPDGCWITGQTMHCVATTTYTYLPGTQGGFVPA
jgi:hypothetical protein